MSFGLMSMKHLWSKPRRTLRSQRSTSHNTAMARSLRKFALRVKEMELPVMEVILITGGVAFAVGRANFAIAENVGLP